MLRFFIDRPIFASVISIIIVLAGAASLRALPIELYPDVVPPQVVVQAMYPGASGEVLADTVAAPLEQEINGVDDMIYMESTTTDSGSLSITVSFEIRSEEHTSELQSRGHLVCRLLLEKKKNSKKTSRSMHTRLCVDQI